MKYTCLLVRGKNISKWDFALDLYVNFLPANDNAQWEIEND